MSRHNLSGLRQVSSGDWNVNGPSPHYTMICLGHEDGRPAVVVIDDTGSNREELYARARLIIAAPDLLEAAARALNFIANKESELGITLDSGDLLRAAIAKAKGA